MLMLWADERYDRLFQIGDISWNTWLTAALFIEYHMTVNTAFGRSLGTEAEIS